MGFNFYAGHADDICEPGNSLGGLLHLRFGSTAPLGTRGKGFVVPDDLAWENWSELQAFAREELGHAGSANIRAVDAWRGVYLDVRISREVLWLPGASRATAFSGSFKTRVWFSRPLVLLRRLFSPRGPSSVQRDKSEVILAVDRMVTQFGARAGEAGGLQVGDLRGLMRELNSLLDILEIERSVKSVESLRREYVTDLDRIDADGHIQCLCHAWLSSSWALESGSPLWLLK